MNTIVPITFEEVAAVAGSLADAGQKVTMLAIRGQLGRGSFSTVKKFLNRWQEECIATDKPASSTLPVQLESLWKEARKAASDSLADDREALDQMARELELRFEEMQAAMLASENRLQESERRMLDKQAELRRADVQIDELKVRSRKADAQVAKVLDQAACERAAVQITIEALFRHLASAQSSTEELGRRVSHLQESFDRMVPELDRRMANHHAMSRHG